LSQALYDFMSQFSQRFRIQDFRVRGILISLLNILASDQLQRIP